MKLSAIFVSVNIAATIPLVAQGAAQAAEEAKSDRADWLKSSLASMDQPPPSIKQVARIGNKKLSLSAPAAVEKPNAIISNGVKLQPFVPNRKLPSQRELDLQLVAQTPKLAQETQPLSAQVCEYYSAPQQAYQVPKPNMSGIATYGSTGYIRETSQRVVPSQVVATPGQIRVTRRRSVKPVIHTIAEEEAQTAQAPPNRQEIEQWLDQPQPGERVIKQSGALLVQAPVIAPDEQAIIDKMVDNVNARPAETAGEAPPGEGQSTAGPPPFPLNMLPQDSLKQLIGGRKHRRTDAPPAYFGSWHPATVPTNLPPAGFHTNIRPKSLSAANYGHYAPRMNVTQIRTVNPTPPSSSRNVVSINKRAPQPMKVASYPPYYTTPRI
jgi:hypothetical protein